MHRILQGAVLLVGLLSILTGLQHWFNLESIGAQRDMVAATAAGRANLRADVGGVFVAIGIFAVLGAIRRNPHWAAAALIGAASSNVGRLVSIALDGMTPQEIMPLSIEAICIAMFATAFLAWRKLDENAAALGTS